MLKCLMILPREYKKSVITPKNGAAWVTHVASLTITYCMFMIELHTTSCM